MSNAGDFEDVSLRPNLRPLAFAVLANLFLGGALLGWPYLRGGARAEASTVAFAHFAACLFDAEVAATPGLTLPRGERARFATLALRSEASWPLGCRDALRAVAPDEATFLFPSVKGAEHDLRAGVRQLDRELVALSRSRATGVVPERPLELLAQLQAALVEQTRAGGLDFDPNRDAIRLGEGEDLPTPSIVPLQVGSGGGWDAGVEGDAFVASALDSRSLGHVRALDGRVASRLARRPRLGTMVLGDRETPWVVWTTSEAQCRERGCARRATGLATFTEDRQRLEPYAWLAAHPMGDVESALLIEAQAVWVAAVGEPGQVVLRRFPVPSRSEGEAPLVRPSFERTVETGAIELVYWVTGDPPALVWAGPEGAGLVHAAEGTSPVVLEAPGGRVHREHSAFSAVPPDPAMQTAPLRVAHDRASVLRARIRVASCGDAQTGWIALGSERGVRLRRVDGEGARALELRVSPPDRGALRVGCEEDGAVEVWARQDGALVRARCDLEGCAAPERIVARGVDRFDVVRFRGAWWVAHASGSEAPVWLTRLVGGEPPVTFAPAACWAPARGLCGEPRLMADATRIALAVRQGGDVRVITSEDGETWRGLPGLEQP